ncbi:MAG TPA: YdeI/OmpD-associated family protein [Terriglobales bacterium]|jgi:uncharacterized protein YdeI (YjbR/CyaY-like superfamily)|nr:YdeI/OmpD-associated family protein [Terriglobales bacterium]
MPKPVAKSFKATLVRDNGVLGWVIVDIPFDVHKAWGMGGRPKVKGEINGFAFRTSLFPVRGGGHFMLVNKKMQAGARAFAGAVAQFRLEPDTEERTVTVPAELKRLLAQDRALSRWFERLNYSIRKYLCNLIREPKSAEARVRRAEQMAERLLATMEAEHELPPILQIEFNRRPHAREGWNRMSASHRRMHLLAIFYYKSPEARARRIARMMEETIKFAEKRR